MKNSFFVIITVLMMIKVLLTISYAQKPEMDLEYYLEVPTDIHEKQFPHGHRAPSKREMCRFNKATNSYICGLISSDLAQVRHHGTLLAIELDRPEKCFTCHDGISGANVNICSMVCIGKKIRICPPKITAYFDYPPKGKEKEFHPASELEKAGLLVFRGQLTCLSCHNMVNQEKFHLRVSRNQKMMCRLCHIR